MTDPLSGVHPGMTGRADEVVTKELTVGGHVEGMPHVCATPDDDHADGKSVRLGGAQPTAAGMGHRRQRGQRRTDLFARPGGVKSAAALPLGSTGSEPELKAKGAT